MSWLTKTARKLPAVQALQSVAYWLATLPTQISAVRAGENLIAIDNDYGRFFARPFTKTISQTNPTHQIKLQKWIRSSPKGIFIDVGAGVGLFANTALKQGNASRVYAFESNPSSYPLLLKHISANNLNAEPVHAAISKSAGTLEMPPNTVHTKSSSTCGGSGVQVPTIAFDHFAAEHEINPADIGCVRISSYGHEISALEGMQKTLHELPGDTRVIVEIIETGRPAEKTIAFVKWCGYELTDQSGRHHLFTKQ